MSLGKPSLENKLSFWILCIMIFLSIAFMTSVLLLPGENLAFDSEPVKAFGTGWQLLDGFHEPVKDQLLILPTRIETAGVVRIGKTIPDGLGYPVVLGFRTAHQKVRLYCDNELIYSFGYDVQPIFGESPGAAWNIVRLPKDTVGKQLVLELESPYPSYQGKIDNIEVGSKASLMFWLLRQYSFSLVLTLIIFVSGVVTLVAYCFVIRKDNATGKETLYLGLFAIFASLWMFGECRLIQFFSMPPAVNTCFTFIAMLATPIPLINYIRCSRSEKSSRLLTINSQLLCIVFILAILLQAFNIVDFIEQMPFIHICFVLTCVVMLYAVISDTIRSYDSDQWRLLISLGVLALFFVLETANLYIGNNSVGNMMRIGVLVFIFIQAQAAFANASRIMHMSRLASVDTLTSCLNRNAYNQWLAELEAEKNVGVVIADINNLKTINDTYGHDVGDDAIIRCAKCFVDAFSYHGRCFRIGGDEFAMLGKNLSLADLHSMGEHFRALGEIEQQKVEYPFVVSCGFAVTDLEQDQSILDTVRRADKIMYYNKRQLKADYENR